MIFKTYIQQQYYRNISAEDITDVIRILSDEIYHNMVPFYDPSKHQDIRIIESKTDNMVIWDWRE